MKSMYAVVLVLLIGFSVRANAQTSSAKDLFAGKCAVCHAADGSGGTSIGKTLKIPSFLSAAVQNQSDAELKATIANGKAAMPKFADKLTNTQIEQMVRYIRSLGKK